MASGQRPERLTPREEEVLIRVALGDTNAECARRLGVSPHTVKRHLSAVYGKLGVKRRGQAAARLWSRGRAREGEVERPGAP